MVLEAEYPISGFLSCGFLGGIAWQRLGLVDGMVAGVHTRRKGLEARQEVAALGGTDLLFKKIKQGFPET